MKVFEKEELQERENLLDKLKFEISKSSNGIFNDEELKPNFFIVFYDDSNDGCIYDGGDEWYLFQNEWESIEGLDNPTEGIFTYDGDLTKKELKKFLKHIGFKKY